MRGQRERCAPTWLSAGTPIGPYDLLIAGQALARGAILATGHVAEFQRVGGFQIEDEGNCHQTCRRWQPTASPFC